MRCSTAHVDERTKVANCAGRRLRPLSARDRRAMELGILTEEVEMLASDAKIPYAATGLRVTSYPILRSWSRARFLALSGLRRV